MKKRTILCLYILLLAFNMQAQHSVEKDITIGMMVKISACKNGAADFESMDMYRKTRFTKTVVIDSITGEGVFENFFTPGDFDAKRLPCTYSNKKYAVAALQVFEDKKTGADKRVMLLYTDNPFVIIWVEFDKAIELKEIEF